MPLRTFLVTIPTQDRVVYEHLDDATEEESLVKLEALYPDYERIINLSKRDALAASTTLNLQVKHD